MTIRILPYGPEKAGEVNELYQSVYGRSRPAGYFETKYAVVYPDQPPIAFLAFDENETGTKTPVAFYGALPCFVFSGNKKVSAAQCADAMTHPGFRRQGVFLQLARATMDACEQAGIRLLFGFPNQYSLPGFLGKLGWEQGSRMDCFRLPVRGFAFRKIAKRWAVTGSSYDRYAEYIIRRNVSPQLPVRSRATSAGVQRDEAWTDQKRRTGMRELVFGDSSCWIRIGEDLLVGDCTGEPEALVRQLPRLTGIARRLGLSAVQFHCSPGTAFHKALLSRIRPVPSFTVIFKDFGAGVAYRDLTFTLADIDTF